MCLSLSAQHVIFVREIHFRGIGTTEAVKDGIWVCMLIGVPNHGCLEDDSLSLPEGTQREGLCHFL